MHKSLLNILVAIFLPFLILLIGISLLDFVPYKYENIFLVLFSLAILILVIFCDKDNLNFFRNKPCFFGFFLLPFLTLSTSSILFYFVDSFKGFMELVTQFSFLPICTFTGLVYLFRLESKFVYKLILYFLYSFVVSSVLTFFFLVFLLQGL